MLISSLSQILELRQAEDVRPPLDIDQRTFRSLQAFPGVRPGFSNSSIIALRPWTHLSLNDGSFLKAYGTYEYFEHGPPSLIASISQCFQISHRLQTTMALESTASLSRLRSFTYTGIFPFSHHVNFDGMLSRLEELDVRFAPDVESGLLDDKERIGRAQLQDCWQELMDAHLRLANALRTYDGAENCTVKKFTCGDFRIAGIAEELDDTYVTLCLPTWADLGMGVPGQFHRLKDGKPELV